MVRWIKQPDGSYQHDFSIVERYLDTAIRRLKKSPRVVVWIHDRPFYRSESRACSSPGRKCPTLRKWSCSRSPRLDPATGQTHESSACRSGAPPRPATFWKPVFDGLRRILAQRGMERSMIFGAAVDGYIGPKCFADCKSLAPDVAWFSRAHHIYAVKNLSYFNWGSWGYYGSDVLTVNWDPDDTETGHYRWRTASWKTSIPVTTGAWAMHQCAAPTMFRLAAESLLLCNGGYMGPQLACRSWHRLPGRRLLARAEDRRAEATTSPTTRSLLDCYTYDNGIDHSFATFALLGPGKRGAGPHVPSPLVAGGIAGHGGANFRAGRDLGSSRADSAPIWSENASSCATTARGGYTTPRSGNHFSGNRTSRRCSTRPHGTATRSNSTPSRRRWPRRWNRSRSHTPCVNELTTTTRYGTWKCNARRSF